jgi:hypothetical protein
LELQELKRISNLVHMLLRVDFNLKMTMRMKKELAKMMKMRTMMMMAREELLMMMMKRVVITISE